MITREEALASYERLYDYMVGDDDAVEIDYGEFMELNHYIRSVLRGPTREMVLRMRGEWEWYDEEIGSPLEGTEREWGWRCSKCKTVLPDDFDDPDNPPAMRFCQWCGAPMTDEAVEMVMERLEALKDGL